MSKTTSNLYDNIKIDITDASGKPIVLTIDKGSEILGSVNVNWATFCSKIQLKQKRYGEAGIANLSFVLISSYGRLGGEKNSVLKCPISIGDRVTITLKSNIDLSAYFDMGTGSIAKADGNKKIFVGYVWTVKVNHMGEVDITCYDLLKYLQHQKCFFYYQKGQTAMQIINEAVKSLNLGEDADGNKRAVKLSLDADLFTAYTVDTTGKQEKFYQFDKNFIELTNWLLNRCLMSGFTKDVMPFATYMLFLVDYETESINIGTAGMLGRISPYIISAKSMITHCEMSHSIENDTYNTVYAGIDYVDKDDLGGRWWGCAWETNSTKQYGMIPHYEKFSQSDFLKSDTNMTIEAVKKIIEKMVVLKCKPKVKLNVKSIGNPYLRAGMIVPLQLPKSLVTGFVTAFDSKTITAADTPMILIDEITHTITQNVMEMEFTASVSLSKFVNWKSAKTVEIE